MIDYLICKRCWRRDKSRVHSFHFLDTDQDFLLLFVSLERGRALVRTRAMEWFEVDLSRKKFENSPFPFASTWRLCCFGLTVAKDIREAKRGKGHQGSTLH